tara:strand:+ start:1823 stop:2050 length:228 start_codon:yes stop_codon:yes gene_type:complete
MNKEDEKSIVELIADGEKIVMVRDAVPSGSVGISVVFDDDRKCHGTLDIVQHKELLLQVAETIAIAAQENGSEEE